jgi:hypothetical protein
MESPDLQALIRHSAELKAESAELCELAAEVIAASKRLTGQAARLHDALARTRADRHRAVFTEVRRAPTGPGLWPGPRRQARWAGRGLRRSRAGPEDRFCEGVRNDLRVPLTLEGPARTMRGIVPAWSL